MTIEKSNLSVKICEILPVGLTIHKEDGCCQVPKADCKYNRSNLDQDLQLCHKETTTPRFFTEVLI